MANLASRARLDRVCNLGIPKGLGTNEYKWHVCGKGTVNNLKQIQRSGQYCLPSFPPPSEKDSGGTAVRLPVRSCHQNQLTLQSHLTFWAKFFARIFEPGSKRTRDISSEGAYGRL